MNSGCPVAAPRPETGPREKAFQDLYIQRRNGKTRRAGKAQGPRHDVLPLQLHPLDVDEVPCGGIGAPDDAQRLPRGNPEEEGDEVVIAVVPPPGHPEGKIQLCKGRQDEAHSGSSPKKFVKIIP